VNPVERVVRGVDAWQQAHPAVAMPFAVVRKYGDDRGGALAALLTYYGFLSLFPLLLLLTTAAGYLLARHGDLEQRVLDSVLVEFPIVGDQLREAVDPLHGSPVAVVVGALGLVWGGLGVAQSGQHAMAEVWNVPGVARPGFFPRLARGGVLFVLLGVGLLGTTVLASVSSVSGGALLGRLLLALGTAALNVGLYLAAFVVLTPKEIPARLHRAGAVLGGIVWTGLQAAGGVLVAHTLRRASDVYGFFGSVLGLLSWIYLGAQVAVYAAEVNVVLARRLWPRSIVQPPLTDADKAVLVAIARAEERRPEQEVIVDFPSPAS
jgi:YihY family inner membrane protein